MRMSELHYYKIDVVQATNLKTVLLFSRDKKKVKISDTDFIRQINKMHIAMTRVKALSLLFRLCLLIQAVYSTTITLQKHTAPSDKVRTTSSSSTTSLLPEFESQKPFLPESDIAAILVPTSQTYNSVTHTLKASEQSSLKKIRHKNQKKRKDKKKTNSKKSRRKGEMHRSLSRALLGLEKKSCPTITNYVFKTTAVDIFGDTVDVYPVIKIGNLALDQYFYESFCDVEQCSCGGIDNKKFKSSCKTTHSYTYAKVVKSGEIGWSYIKVRSGCSCVIQEKRRNLKSVLDLIS